MFHDICRETKTYSVRIVHEARIARLMSSGVLAMMGSKAAYNFEGYCLPYEFNSNLLLYLSVSQKGYEITLWAVCEPCVGPILILLPSVLLEIIVHW